MKHLVVLITLAAAVIASSACNQAPSSEAGKPTSAKVPTIAIDGSSTVYPITEAVAEDFQNNYKDAQVTVGISGTGGGFKKFVRGELDIVDASRPIKPSEIQQAKDAGIGFIELAIAYDGITVAVNPANTWCKSMSVGARS
jgi:phosphate transport system substrate-binding protein